MTDVVRKDVMARLGNGDYSCEREFTLAMFSGKWKLVILCHLNEHHSYRFNGLRNLLPTITHKVLTNQLRELEADGLITRKVFEEKQLHVEYSITPLGRSLIPIVEAMGAWGRQRLAAMQLNPTFNVNEAEA